MNKSLRTVVCAGVLTLLPASVSAVLVQTFQATGNYELEVAAVGFGGAPVVGSIGNTLNLATLPGSATPVQAYLYAYDTNHTGGMTATFNGTPLLGGTPIGPYATDSAFSTLYTFRWDVTSLLVPGVTNYSWGFSETMDMFGQQGNSISMAALAVIYSDPSLQTSTATLIDGMTYVGNTHPETESLNITGLPAGSNKIFTLTYFDDNAATGETIDFNGTTIGGPLDQNLTINGSLTQMTGTSVSGPDMLGITTQSDEFGWVLAASLTTVPVPPSVWLFGTGVLALIAFARFRKSD